jgi:hypothetical protein
VVRIPRKTVGPLVATGLIINGPKEIVALVTRLQVLLSYSDLSFIFRIN